jgi:antitoxin component of MazEF toxin-antitoxin module
MAMIIQRVFKSGNTMRMTIPRPIRRALSLQCGDHLAMSHTAAGVVTLTNLTEEGRQKQPRKKRK